MVSGSACGFAALVYAGHFGDSFYSEIPATLSGEELATVRE
jgi:hypothetical protein